jgi:hypothetical protein
MLAEKLVICVSVGKSAAQSTRIASFRPLAITSSPASYLGAFHLKDEAPTGAGARADFGKSLSHAKLSAISLRPAI